MTKMQNRLTLHLSRAATGVGIDVARHPRRLQVLVELSRYTAAGVGRFSFQFEFS